MSSGLFCVYEIRCPNMVLTRLHLRPIYGYLGIYMKLRRFNVVRHVAPFFQNMSMEPTLFSSRQHQFLFGEKFIKALDKEADLYIELYWTRWPSQIKPCRRSK